MSELLAELQAALRDRYTIERELGRGGMAVVYLAHDVKHGREVALKVLRPELGSSVGAERFLREIQLAAKLTHPHILPLYESGEANGLLFYTMPYLEGESLRDRLNRETQLPIEEALQITREVAEALSYAHTLGVVHRDIKPENILFEAGHAMVADFGIARAVSEAGGTKLTETGMAVGTPAYMSPEQAAGLKGVDARADVYSLGCVLFEMLGGEPPYTGPTPHAIIARKVSDPLPSLRVLREAVAAPLEQIVFKSLAKVPADRYSTAGEMADALSTEHIAEALVKAKRRQRIKRIVRHPVTLALLALPVVYGAFQVLSSISNPGSGASVGDPVSLMVKPFTYLGPPEQASVAEEVTQEVRMSLGGLSGLRVTARQTSERYGGPERTLQEIGEEVGVQYVLDGTVREQATADGAQRLRVSVGLAGTADGAEIWSQTYDRELTDAAALDMQRRLAGEVVEALGVQLSPRERRVLEGSVRESPQMLELLERGGEQQQVGEQGIRSGAGYRAALRLFEGAVALDSTSQLAWAHVAWAHFNLYAQGYDRTRERLALARSAMERASELHPGEPVGHLVQAAYASTSGDYDLALQRLETALELEPDNDHVLDAMARVRRRRGEWEEAFAVYNGVLAHDDPAVPTWAERDPRIAYFAWSTGQTLCWMRRYEDGGRYIDSALAIVLTDPAYNQDKARCLLWSGERDEARRFLESAEGMTERPLWELWSRLELVDGDPEAALGHVPAGRDGYWDSAWIYTVLDRAGAARAYWDSVRVDTEAQIRLLPADAPEQGLLQVRLGEAYAGLGRNEEALAASQRGVEILPLSADAVSGAVAAEALARVYVLVGDYDAAVEQLDVLLSVPSEVHVEELRRHPIWNPLRGHPRFRELVR
ncbi:MAG: protein kinase domain-containing protein [Planctomycetota bacterium]|jgi:serine/threonine-protein kinase